MALGNGAASLELGVISDFITQAKFLGGSTPQTPRRDLTGVGLLQRGEQSHTQGEKIKLEIQRSIVKSNAEKQISQAVVVHSFRASTSFVNTASYRTGNLEFWPGHDQIEQFDSGVEVDCGSQSGKTQYGQTETERMVSVLEGEKRRKAQHS